MQINKIKELIKKHSDNLKDMQDLKLDVKAINSASVKGYIVIVCLNGIDIIVSSKREDKRVFKNLDTLKKTLRECGVNKFTVIG